MTFGRFTVDLGLMRMTVKEVTQKVGSLSKPSKMPGHGYSTPAKDCITGSKLAEIVNSICSICYAKKGRYVFPNVIAAMEKRLNSLSSLHWVDYITFLIGKQEKSGYFRWHDSGDVQGVWHLEKIAEVARRLPNIKFWLPTREYGFVREWMKFAKVPKNLTIRLSAYMVDGKPPTSLAKKLGLTTSGVAPKGFNCPASKQDNQCAECRACWDGSVENINYKKH